MPQQPILCDRDHSLLLLVDLQTRLTAAMPDDEAVNMLDNSRALLKAAELLEIPVLLTEQYPQGLGPTDSTLLEALPAPAQRFDKTRFSCFGAEGFPAALEASNRRQILLLGQETHVCVLQTAFELLQRDYQVFVVEDAVCSRKQAHKYFALERMQQAGAVITSYESVLFEWLRDATHPHFKTISKLIV